MSALDWFPSFIGALKLRRWLWVAFGVFALTVLYGAYYTYLILPQLYFGEALIQVQPQQAESLNSSDSTNRLKPELETLWSAELLEPIISDLNLDLTWAKREYKSSWDALPPSEALFFLRGHLKLNLVPGTDLIRIRFASVVPKEAADVANAIADRYQTMRNIEVDREESTLHDQVAVQQEVLDMKNTVEQQAIVDGLKARLKKVAEDDKNSNSQVRIIRLAEVPEKPSLPNNAYNMLLSTGEGLFYGFWAATLVEFAIWFALRTAKYTGRTDSAPAPSDEY